MISCFPASLWSDISKLVGMSMSDPDSMMPSLTLQASASDYLTLALP